MDENIRDVLTSAIMGVVGLCGIIALLLSSGCGCSNPLVGQCEAVGTIVDFDLDITGTGIGAGSQVWKYATVTLDNGDKFIESNYYAGGVDIVDDIAVGKTYYLCQPCYGFALSPEVR